MSEILPQSPPALRVLLVEDEALIALDTQDTLEAAGYVVVGIADRVESASRLATVEEFDLAVLDVRLNGSQIWPVTEILRGRCIPFVLLTGMLSSADVPPSCAGAPRLSKPIDRRRLVEAVATLAQELPSTLE